MYITVPAFIKSTCVTKSKLRMIEHQCVYMRAFRIARETSWCMMCALAERVVLLSTSREFLAMHLLFKRRPSVQTFAFVISNEPPAETTVCLPALFSPLSQSAYAPVQQPPGRTERAPVILEMR